MSLDMIRLNDLLHMRDEAEILADEAMVEAALDRMAAAITARLADADPIVFAVMNGGMVPTGRLLPRFDFPLELSYLHATRYGDATQGEEIEWRVCPTDCVQGRTVLVIDDVLDVGHTLVAIIDRLRELGAREV
ncbi:MAG: hypoxanthine-guanine phosphoribosyltransferase, partial [Azoarcus sp.]|nr:hypoxanthine-guanine phosphoribosyltransferase [Azoarcus sp.]